MEQTWKGLNEAQQNTLESISEMFKRDNERVDTLATLSQVGQALLSLESAPGELERLLQKVAESALRVLGADIVTVYQYFQERDEFLAPPVQVGDLKYPDVPKNKVFKDDVVVKIVRGGSSLYSPDAQGRSEFSGPFETELPERPKQRFVVREEIASSAAVLLKARDEIVGVLFVNYRSPQSFVEEQRGVIELFASQAAVAIYNARLYEETRQRADTLATLSQVGQALVSLEATSGALERLLRQVAEGAQRVLGADIVVVYQYVREQDEFLVPPVQAGKLREPAVPKDRVFPEDVAFTVVRRERSLYSPTVQGEPDFSAPFKTERPNRPAKRFVVREGIVSSAAVPLRAGNEIVGVMFVNYRKPQPFTREQQEIIELFANQAAVAIYNARLFDLINKQKDELQTINSIGTLLIATLDVREVPRRLMQQVIPLFRAERASLWMIDHETRSMECRLSLNRDGQEDGITTKMRTMSPSAFQLGKGVSGFVAQSGVPVIINDVQKDHRWDGSVDAATGFTAHTILAVPLIHQGKTIGVFELANRTDDTPFAETDRDLMVALASIAAIALANATAYERAYADLQKEQEKREVAEKLGAFGQAAANLSHKMNNVGGIIPVCVQKIRKHKGNVADKRVQKNLDIIEQQARFLLSAAKDLRRPFEPSPEIELDINSSVNEALEATQPLWQDKIRVEPSFSDNLPKVKTRERLKDAFVELITNAAKAMPRGGRLEIETRLVNRNTVEISFTDTGCGIPEERRQRIFEPIDMFKPADQSDRPGNRLGLWGVRTFLRQHGGDIELRWSEVSKGSQFVIIHPVSG